VKNPILVAALLCCLPWAIRAEEGKTTNLLKPTNSPDTWRLEQIEEGKGAMKAAGDAIQFDVTHVDGTEWHVQAFQVDLDLKEGQTYAVTFKAKASAARSMILVAMIDEDDWHEIGLHEDIYLRTEYQSYEFTFRATDVVKKKNRIGFMFGQETGSIFLKDMTLTAK
jgi:cystathionine beta-lyase/cystathionine gamma-synthase